VPCQAAQSTVSEPKPSPATPATQTEQMLREMDARQQTSQAGGAGGSTTWEALLRADSVWSQLRNKQEGAAAGPPPSFVQESSQPLSSQQQQQGEGVAVHDVVVCGGTLGIFVATALARRGWRVAVVERGPLKGRAQEWNVSRKEVLELVEAGLLEEREVDEVIAKEFNPVRVGFYSGVGPDGKPQSKDVWTRDVLNCGVRPDLLIARMRSKLEALGGKVYELAALQGVQVAPNGCTLSLKSMDKGSETSMRVHSRLVIDCMGHASPIVQQIRWGKKPDGICIVVGTLGSGFQQNTTADVIYTNSHSQPDNAKANKLQFFWEAFPAGSGPTDRTTYMFAYLDAEPWRPSMLDIFEEYWPRMAEYQGVMLEDIDFKRALFGFFPTYRDSPLQPRFDRVLQIGDASGIQSPLSFGGFGAMTRHMRRLDKAIHEALAADALDKGSLGLIHAYNPSLSSAWMMQKAMSLRPGQSTPPDLINRMLGGNFSAMEEMGDPVMKPFLQDVMQFGPLVSTISKQMVNDPAFVPPLLAHVGPGPLADWLVHVLGLGAYTLGNFIATPLKTSSELKGLVVALMAAGSSSPLTAALSSRSGSSSSNGNSALDLSALLGSLSSSAAAGAALPASTEGIQRRSSQGEEKLTPRQLYTLNRILEALEYGSGSDYKL